MNIFCLSDRGPLSYTEVDGVQCEIRAAVARGEGPDTLIVWQAKGVCTVGRRTRPEDAPDPLVPVVRIDHGGSVTYHGSGQTIVYPIACVRPSKDAAALVRAVEVAVIKALSTFGVRGERVVGYSDVWVGGEKIRTARLKFASDAIMYGLVLNMTTDVSKFFRVNPRGITGTGVTSMGWQGVDASLEKAAMALTPALGKHLASFQQEG